MVNVERASRGFWDIEGIGRVEDKNLIKELDDYFDNEEGIGEEPEEEEEKEEE